MKEIESFIKKEMEKVQSLKEVEVDKGNIENAFYYRGAKMYLQVVLSKIETLKQ